jgi:hypothetical protein
LRISDLDACLPDEPVKWGGALSPEQLAWLDSKLTKHSREMNLIFMHHNFLAWSEDEMTGGPKQCFNIDNAAKVRATAEHFQAPAFQQQVSTSTTPPRYGRSCRNTATPPRSRSAATVISG